ncbi:MAG: DUF3987 domain-containing protein [Polyangia bacterium]
MTTAVPTVTMLDAALEYAARGFHVFPIRPRDKKPPLTKNGFHDATVAPETIKRWWERRPDANIGMLCAISGVVVIDVDYPSEFHKIAVAGEVTLAALVAKLGKLPETVEAVTGGGGRHLVFTAPANVQFKGTLGPGVDLKHEGYIVVWPSIYPNGNLYRWLRSPLDQMPAPLPAAWLAAMAKPTAKVALVSTTTRMPNTNTNGCSAYGRAAIDAEIATVITAQPGTQNNTLNTSSLKLGSLFAGGEIDDVRDQLVAAAVTAGQPEGPSRATVNSGWTKGLQTPRTAPLRDRKPAGPNGKTAKTAKTATAESESVEWGEPQPLVAEVPREAYPKDALPKLFREAVDEVQAFVQAPVEMVAMAALGAASTAVQSLVDVERAEGLKGPVGIYSLALALSGERKSSLDGRFYAPIRDFELAQAAHYKPLSDAFRADLASWEAKKRGIASRIEKASRDGKSTADDEDRLRKLEQDQPNPPRVPTITNHDSTMEALAYGLATTWPSACVTSSEAGSVFGSHSMGKDSLMRTLSFYDTMWDGGALRVARRTAGGSYWVKNARLTLTLQVQPGTFEDFLRTDRGLSRDIGFLSRVLVAVPESAQGKRKFKEAPKSWPALTRFSNRISALLNAPVHVDEDGGLEVTTLKLAPATKTAWVAFHDKIESELAIGGSLTDVRDVAAKAADNACRLAAVFEVVEHGIAMIELPAFESAAQIVEWHLNEARRFFGEMAQPEENVTVSALDAWLLEFCRARKVSAVPVSAVQKTGPRKLRAKAALDAAVKELEALGRARLVKGQGKSKTIEINPALLAAAVIAVNAVIAQSARKAVI